MVWERYCYASPKPEFFYIFFVYIFIYISANMSPFGLKLSQMILHTETSKLMYNWFFLFVHVVLRKPTLFPSTFKPCFKTRPPSWIVACGIAVCKGLHTLRDSWFCDCSCDACVMSICAQVLKSRDYSWVHLWGFYMSKLRDWSRTSVAQLPWQNVKCSMRRHGAQPSAHVVCGVCSRNCSWDAESYNRWAVTTTVLL